MTEKTLLDITLDIDSWSLCKNKNQIILSIEKLYENDDDFMAYIDSLLAEFNNENEIKITIGDILNKKIASEKIELINNFLDKILNNFNISIKLNNGVSLTIEGEINNIQNAVITIIGKNRLDDINLMKLSESIKQIIIELKVNVERLLNKKMAENINFEEIEKFIDNLSHKMQKNFLLKLHEEVSKISSLSREMGSYIIPGQLKNILLMYNKLNFQEKTRLYNNFRYVINDSGTQKLHIETIRYIIKLFKNHVDLLDNLLFIEKFTKPIVADEEGKATVVVAEEKSETVVVDEEPEETVVVDEEPEETVVVDEEPEETVVVDEEPEETVVVVDEEPEAIIVAEEKSETVVVDEEPEAIIVAEEKSETVVVDEEPEETVVVDEELIINDCIFQILEDKDFEKIGRYINSLENYEQCKFLENFIEKGIELDSLAYKNRKNITPAKLIISFYSTNPASKKALLKNLNSVFADGEKLSIYNIRRICGLFKKNLYLLGALQIPVEEILKQEFEEIIEPTFIINTPIIDTPEKIADENLIQDTPEEIADKNPIPDKSDDIIDENLIQDTPENKVVENIKLTNYVLYLNAAIRGSLKKAIREKLLYESDLALYEVREEDFTLSNGDDFLTRTDIKNHVKKIHGIRINFDTDKKTKSLKNRWKNAQSIVDPTIFFNLILGKTK